MLRSLFILAACASMGWCWWDTWPYTEHQDLMSRSIDIAMERYPDMASDIDACRDELLSGAHDEDLGSDPVNGSYADYSGYCCEVPDAWWPTATRHLNAIQWIRDGQNPNSWDSAVGAYGASRSDAYYRLGHVLHNLQDMFVPAHSHVAPHGSGTSGLVENHSWPLYVDNFEQWCEVTSTELDIARPEHIPELEIDSLFVGAAGISAADNDSAGFYPTQYFAPPDSAGDWGKYRPYPSGGYPCGNDGIDNDLANSWSPYLVPLCCEYVAGAIRDFYVTCNPTAVADQPSPTRTAPLPGLVRPGMVALETDSPADVTWLDASGRVAYRETGTKHCCPRLSSGIYFLRVAGLDARRPVTVLSNH